MAQAGDWCRMELLALVSTRLDLLRAGLLAGALTRDRLQVACYLRYRSAFDPADLEWLGLTAVSWLLPTQGEPSGRTAETVAWAGECLGDKPPHVLLLGDTTEATLPFALTAAKCGVTVACLEAGLPGPDDFERERLIAERLATFHISPLEQAAACLQEEGLACQRTADLLLAGHTLANDVKPAEFLGNRGLAAGHYAVVAADGDPLAVTVSGMPTVPLAGPEGLAGEGVETLSCHDWLALLTHSGYVVSDSLAICRLAAGAGIGAALVAPAERNTAWLGDLAVVPAESLPTEVQPQERPVAPAGDGVAAVAGYLTKGG